MANTVTVYLSPGQLGAPADSLPHVLRRAVADAITAHRVNVDGRIELLLVVVVEEPNVIDSPSAAAPAEEPASAVTASTAINSETLLS
jgi:hypothetical protein